MLPNQRILVEIQFADERKMAVPAHVDEEFSPAHPGE
jgi:hypothetical protein